jgi:hypothetical protein
MNADRGRDNADGGSVSKRLAWWFSAVVAAVGVFFAWLDPDLMVSLANTVWSCF